MKTGHDDGVDEQLRLMLRQELEYAPQQESLRHHVDANDRQRLVRWCFQVMDYCKLDRTLVEIAVNYTDRYVSMVPKGWTRARYQLLAMTAVYTAVKIFAVEAMDPLLVSRKLSRGAYTVADIEHQELDLLSLLQWRMNPPTAASFIGLYLDIIVQYVAVPLSQQYAVYDFAMEHAMESLEYLPVRLPSEVAFESLVTALRVESYLKDEKIAWVTSLLPVTYSYRIKPPSVPAPIGSPRTVAFIDGPT